LVENSSETNAACGPYMIAWVASAITVVRMMIAVERVDSSGRTRTTRPPR